MQTKESFIGRHFGIRCIGLNFKRGSQRAITKLTLEQGRHRKTQIRFHV